MPLRPVTATSCEQCSGTLWRRCYDGAIRICACEGPVPPLREHWIYQNKHQLVLLCVCGHAAWVDEGIADDVSRLWEAGIWTWASCQGDDNDTRDMIKYLGICDKTQMEKARSLLPWAVYVHTTGFGDAACIYAKIISENELA